MAFRRSRVRSASAPPIKSSTFLCVQTNAHQLTKFLFTPFEPSFRAGENLSFEMKKSWVVRNPIGELNLQERSTN